MMNTSGSEWRKWDLHIHTTASDGKSNCLEIIQKAKDEGLSVIAITDHHTASNVDKAKKIGKELNISVISGIEFRSEYGSKSVHFIGLFPDSFENIELNSKALQELILNPLGLSETEIIAKGKQIKPTSNDLEAFKEGIFRFQVAFKNASDLIHRYNGLVSVHAGSKENSLDREVKHQGSGIRNTNELYDSLGTLKEELMKSGYIDICEIRKENDSEDFYLNQFNKPSIVASDAHTIEEIGKKYVWIKADTTFEGLRQITYEPKERVRISDNIPEKKNNYLVIDRITINHDDFGIQELPLNPNLNTIIGGKSSGKSILLGAIAKKIGTDRNVKHDKPEYNKYIENNLVPKINVKWKDDLSDSERKIEYFPQTYINSLAANSDDVNKLIEDIVKSDSQKKAEIENYLNKRIANRTNINLEISDYFQLIEKNKEYKEKMVSLGSKNGITKQITELKDELAKIKSKMEVSISETEQLEYQIKQVKLDKNQKQNELLEKEAMALSGFYDLVQLRNIDNDLINIQNDTRETLMSFYKELAEQLRIKWNSKLTELIDSFKNKISALSSDNKEIETNDIFIKCKEYYSKNEYYTNTEQKIKNEQKRLSDIELMENEIDKISKSIRDKKNKIIELHNLYFIMSDEFAQKIQYEEDDVKITCAVHFQPENFKKSMEDHFDKRNSEIQNIVAYKHITDKEYIVFLDSLFDKIINGNIQFKGGSTAQQVIINIFSNPYYEIRYDVVYENDSLSAMSEGKKAFIIMKILLDFNGNGYPILIDQPEDDLDNRTIYDQLVNYLRKKKKQRQIIVVTHNPNIVVGADAEEVICANQHGIGNENGVKFQYITGSLENTKKKDETLTILKRQGIREHVCDILEGGNEAFLKREKIYRIKEFT